MTNLFPDPDGGIHEEQVGGGNYSLRRNIPISPNAPPVMAHMAMQRRLAVEASDAQDAQAAASSHGPSPGPQLNAQNAVFSSSPPSGSQLATLGLKPVKFGNGHIFQPDEYFQGLDISTLAVDAPIELTPEPERGPVPTATSATSDPFTTAPSAPARAEDLFTPTRTYDASSTPNPANLYTPPSPTTARPSAGPPVSPFSPLTARPSKVAQANMGPVHAHVLDLMEFGPPGEMPEAPDAPTSVSVSHDMDIDEAADEEEEEEEDRTGTSPMGRISQKDHEILKKGHERAYKIFLEIASQTGRSIDFVISNFNIAQGHGSGRNFWNLYQGYFAVNMERERKRAKLPRGTAQECWTSFRAHPGYQELLSTFERADTAKSNNFTIAQREKLHERQFKSVVDIMSSGEQHKFEGLYVQVGSCVNEDQGLGKAHATAGLEGFWDYVGFSENTLIGLARTFSYSNIAKDFISEYVAQRDAAALERTEAQAARTTDVPIIKTAAPHVTGVPVAIPDLDSKVDSKARAELERAELKLRFVESFDKIGYKTKQLPWSTLAKNLAEEAIQIENWPIEVPFPGDDKRAGKASQGIKDLNTPHVRILLAAFENTATRPIFKKGDSHALSNSKHPVIVTSAPSFESKHERGRRLFANGYKDTLGLPKLPRSAASTTVKRKGSKNVPTQAAHPEVISIASSSPSPPSKRTRGRTKPETHSRNKSKKPLPVVIDSDDEPVRPKAPKPVKNVPVVSDFSSELSDSDADGLHTADKDDGDFNQLTDSESEAPAPPSPHKGKAKIPQVKEKRKIVPKSTKQQPAETVAPKPRPQPRPAGSKVKMVAVVIPPSPLAHVPPSIAPLPKAVPLPSNAHTTSVPPPPPVIATTTGASTAAEIPATPTAPASGAGLGVASAPPPQASVIAAGIPAVSAAPASGADPLLTATSALITGTAITTAGTLAAPSISAPTASVAIPAGTPSAPATITTGTLAAPSISAPTASAAMPAGAPSAPATITTAGTGSPKRALSVQNDAQPDDPARQKAIEQVTRIFGVHPDGYRPFKKPRTDEGGAIDARKPSPIPAASVPPNGTLGVDDGSTVITPSLSPAPTAPAPSDNTHLPNLPQPPEAAHAPTGYPLQQPPIVPDVTITSAHAPPVNSELRAAGVRRAPSVPPPFLQQAPLHAHAQGRTMHIPSHPMDEMVPGSEMYQGQMGPYPNELQDSVDRYGYGQYMGGAYNDAYRGAYPHPRRFPYEPHYDPRYEQYGDVRYNPYGDRGFNDGFGAYGDHRIRGPYPQRQGPHPRAPSRGPLAGPSRHPHALRPDDLNNHPQPDNRYRLNVAEENWVEEDIAMTDATLPPAI